jgi:hypothetical protein
MQEENKKEAKKKEEERSVETSASTTLEGKEIKKTGWSIKMVEQNETQVLVKIACKDHDFNWYRIKLRIPKDKLKR